MYIGVDYYPEHWSRERWDIDAQMMKDAGFNIVRLAEFAWVNMEPREGVFEFGWLDDALGVLQSKGIQAILCTPTAVMPAWAAKRYPDTLAMQKDGTRITWGVRKNNCFSSATYRLLSERITQAMVEHFKHSHNVIGWQTDNEFGNPVCYCPLCQNGFQEWLKRKYETLDVLNQGWGTHFWGHLYGDWAEIPIPIDPATHNPSACLDWQRFFSHLNVSFQREQVRILRNITPEHFVTHNFMGLFHELDYYDLAEDLDFVSWDNYPVWGKPGFSYSAAQAADVMRGLKKKNFWIMEQTSGPGGWSTYGRNPRPGEIRKIAFQQVAHGADHILWFRWRACTAGREQYWHGILGHDGKGLRRYMETAQTAGDLRKLEPALTGTMVKAEVAIIYDYDSIWAVRIQPGYDGNNYHAAMDRIYQALNRAGVNVDFIQSTDSFDTYRVVFAPDLYILPDPVARSLSTYVEKGGVLFTDSRSAAKDETGLMHPRTLPGLLSDALGITIEEYESLGHDWAGDQAFTYPVIGDKELAGVFTAVQTAEWVKTTTAEQLAGYDGTSPDAWHMQGFSALTRNNFGKGWGYFLGTVIKEPEFYDSLVADILEHAILQPVFKPPRGVEVSIREADGKRLLFLINHLEEIVEIPVTPGKKELLTEAITGETLRLGRFGVAVIAL